MQLLRPYNDPGRRNYLRKCEIHVHEDDDHVDETQRVENENDIGRIDQDNMECILKSTSSVQNRWYKIKWKNGEKSSWVKDDLVPDDMKRKFHVEKTLQGKSKRNKKRKRRN